MIKNYDKDSIELLYKLIGTRSDSHTPYEVMMESVLIEEIQNIPYFQENTHLFGRDLIKDDPLGRSVVWALHHQNAPKTIILFGHHDAVDLSAYGDLNGLSPDELVAHLNQSECVLSDLDSGQWLPGRGSCDMKAGLCINLMQLKQATQESNPVNVLFLSVPDEETASAGMRYAVNLLKSLKDKYEFTYELAILTEPHEREENDTFTLSTGSVGKMMPVIVSKGMPSHSGIAYSGLNSISIAMEIVKAIELNTEMGDTLNKRMTPPPAFLNLFSIKNTYDVTTPEYTVAYFNWLYLKSNLNLKLERLRELCKWSMEDAINQFNYSYNEYLRKQSMPSYRECMDFDFEILLYEELLDRVNRNQDASEIIEKVKMTHAGARDHEISVQIIIALIDTLKLNYPVVVIGFLPPFYPVVSSDSYYQEKLKDIVESQLDAMKLSVKENQYYMGISDMSFMKRMDHCPEVIMKQMPQPFPIDFNGIDSLDIEVVHIGPWGKDLHLKTERVYLKDVTETVPRLISSIIKQI